MKARKLGWQGILAGVALCAVLALFLGGKAADAQITGTQQITKVATMNDIYQATADMDAKITAMEVRLARMEKKIDALSEQSDLIFKMIKKMYKHAGIE